MSEPLNLSELRLEPSAKYVKGVHVKIMDGMSREFLSRAEAEVLRDWLNYYLGDDTK